MSFDEDLNVFFQNADFADTVTVSPSGRTFQAIFDETYFDPESGETVLDTTAPRLTCRLSDLTGVTDRALISIKGKTYSVINVQPDGTGTAMVKLSHQTPR